MDFGRLNQRLGVGGADVRELEPSDEVVAVRTSARDSRLAGTSVTCGENLLPAIRARASSHA